MPKRTYVLVTAAYNEEALIGKAIASIVAQTCPPKEWVIVSDGSTDRTDEIVRQYEEECDFIRLLSLRTPHARDFAAQVNAINSGVNSLTTSEYQFIGNLDADVTFEPTYYENLLQKFEQDPRLGLAGGYIQEKHGRNFTVRRTNSTASVAHAVQLFRRECFESIGGYTPLQYGGPDWYAEVSLRMRGWGVRSFPDLPVFHHRPTGTADQLLRHRFRQGRLDFSLGSHPLFEIVKCLKRVPEKPAVTGAISRLAGFCWSYVRKQPRSVPRDFVSFLRREQLDRLLAFSKLGKRDTVS
jgi:glycosyltransferase involved in cell wall biosynthesis